MKISLIFIALALIQICQVYCTLGVDTKFFVTSEQFQCIKSQGYQFAVVRAYLSYGAIDPNAVQILKNVLNGRLIPLISMSPCRGKDPILQVKDIIASIPSNFYTIPFINVEINLSPGCSWGAYSFDSNCQFVKDILNAFQTYGKDPGIYVSSSFVWNTIFGNMNACPGVASQPLWYANYDNNPSFNDFKGIGGWNKAKIKQFKGDTNICGVIVNLNFL